jgi:hypothetical protein
MGDRLMFGARPAPARRGRLYWWWKRQTSMVGYRYAELLHGAHVRHGIAASTVGCNCDEVPRPVVFRAGAR